MPGRPKGTGGKAQELTLGEIRRFDKCLVGTRHELRNRALLAQTQQSCNRPQSS